MSEGKIRTNFAQIIVGGKPEKPYYEILYFDTKENVFCLGFGSYYLDFVFKWLKEEFEIQGNLSFYDFVLKEEKGDTVCVTD